MSAGRTLVGGDRGRLLRVALAYRLSRAHRLPGKHGTGRAIFAIVMGALGSAVLVLVIVSAHSH